MRCELNRGHMLISSCEGWLEWFNRTAQKLKSVLIFAISPSSDGIVPLSMLQHQSISLVILTRLPNSVGIAPQRLLTCAASVSFIFVWKGRGGGGGGGGGGPLGHNFVALRIVDPRLTSLPNSVGAVDESWFVEKIRSLLIATKLPN